MKLKHIVGYLPYGLKAYQTIYTQVKGGRDKITTQIKKVNSTSIYNFFEHSPQNGNPSNYIKPILRPLSDLTKEIEVNGEKFVPIVKLATLLNLSMYQFIDGAFYSNNYGKFLEIKEMPYLVIEKLYEWHFDIHNLIEKGEAIDINTI